MNRLAATLADPLGQIRQLAGLDQQEAFAETPEEKQARIMQQLQDPATRQQALQEAMQPATQAATEAMGKIGGTASPWDSVLKAYQGTRAAGGAQAESLSAAFDEAYGKGLLANNAPTGDFVAWLKKHDVPLAEPNKNFNWQELHDALADLKKPSGGPAKVYEYKPPPGVVSMNLNAPAPAEQNVAMQVLQASHGIDPANVANIQKYTKEAPESILQRFDAARRNAVAHGLGPENTAAERAGLMGYKQDIGDPGAWLVRGGSQPREAYYTPDELGLSYKDISGTPYALFGSFQPGAHPDFPPDVLPHILATAYGNVRTPLVAPFTAEQLFNATNPEHVNRALSAGMPSRFAEMFSDNAPSIAYTSVEHRSPIEAIAEAGFPGFLTTEGNSLNWGIFDPTPLRHPLAAFDPARADVRNLFAGLAVASPVAALAAALARQQQPQGAPVQ